LICVFTQKKHGFEEGTILDFKLGLESSR
jgi:hypothetical protein